MGIVSGRIRKQVYKKCDGNCAYCGKPVMFPAMQVDHLLPTYWGVPDEELAAKGVVRGTDHIENLMPACRRCNKWKTVYDIEVFRNEIKQQYTRLLRDVPGYKLALDYGLIKEVEWDGLFYFEKMSGFSMSHKRVTA